MNISYETKLVDIKKKLDRKKSQNHHINEIIEELFYPEMRLQNEQQVEMRVKQMNNDAALLG
jgi:disulfide oxidoreductase YuzD